MKSAHLNHVLWLTVATIFISTSGTLGKYIDMPIPVIIWWRCALASIFIALYSVIKQVTKFTNNNNKANDKTNL